MVQLPWLRRVTLAEDIPPEVPLTGVTVWLVTEQGPVATKFTCNPLGAPFPSAVAVTVMTVGGVFESAKELANGPRTMVWTFFMIAGTEGGLERCDISIGTGRSIVEIV
jgi:hypothetical protein